MTGHELDMVAGDLDRRSVGAYTDSDRAITLYDIRRCAIKLPFVIVRRQRWGELDALIYLREGTIAHLKDKVDELIWMLQEERK